MNKARLRLCLNWMSMGLEWDLLSLYRGWFLSLHPWISIAFFGLNLILPALIEEDLPQSSRRFLLPRPVPNPNRRSYVCLPYDQLPLWGGSLNQNQIVNRENYMSTQWNSSGAFFFYGLVSPNSWLSSDQRVGLPTHAPVKPGFSYFMAHGTYLTFFVEGKRKIPHSFRHAHSPDSALPRKPNLCTPPDLELGASLTISVRGFRSWTPAPHLIWSLAPG